jgi:hypothetical protein
MTTTKSSQPIERSLSRDWIYAARYYLGGRKGLLIVAALVIAAGLAFNWSWLVAAGIAPLLIGVLPCVAMCALGLCMRNIGGQSCSTGSTVGKAADPAADEAHSPPSVRSSAAMPMLPPAGIAVNAPDADPSNQSEPAKPERNG